MRRLMQAALEEIERDEQEDRTLAFKTAISRK
jgi:hypothetical protein